MKYDFDTFIDRHGTSCIKFDFAKERGHSPDELSYWVADMDFKTAPEIISAIKKRVDHGIFGYTDPKEDYFEPVFNWYKHHFGYETKQEWLSVTPGVVSAIATAIQAYTEKGDAVLIQSPVYYPFPGTIAPAGRKVVSSDLVWNGKTYEIDFDDFEKKIRDEKVKLFLLCNPHNPGGRSWTKAELSKIGEICLKYKVIVFSDEIHSDFIWDEYKHTVFASLSPELEKITITGTAPTKTFNLAGLQVSNIFTADETLKRKFKTGLDIIGYSQASVLGMEACKAAYTYGEEWLNQVKNYINDNLNKSVQYINSKIQGVSAPKPQSTYLLWIDCRGLGLTDRELNERIRNKAKLWLDAGRIFGKVGENFQRINVATSWSYLEQGLERFTNALKD